MVQLLATAARDGVWAHYRSLRLAAQLRPLGNAERAAVQHVAAAMQGWLGLDAAAARREARRAIAFQREGRLHESLMLDLPPADLATLVGAVPCAGSFEPLRGGGLMAALHYSLCDSLMPLRLARLAVRGAMPPTTMVYDSGAAGTLGLPAARLDALAAAGLLSHATLELLDLRGVAPAEALSDRLRGGRVVLVLPDATFLPADDWRGVALPVGRRAVGVPRGALGLAVLLGRPIVPAALRPDGDGHGLVVGPAIEAASRRPDEARRAAERALAWLAAETIAVDPAPWRGWGMLPRGEGS